MDILAKEQKRFKLDILTKFHTKFDEYVWCYYSMYQFRGGVHLGFRSQLREQSYDLQEERLFYSCNFFCPLNLYVFKGVRRHK